MIVFNFTGLDRMYWLPKFSRGNSCPGVWFYSVKWLGLELIASSKDMATVMIYRLGMHRWNQEGGPDDAQR